EYKYFTYPLPGLIAELRSAAYPPLAGVANRWNAAMRIDTRYPEDLETFRRQSLPGSVATLQGVKILMQAIEVTGPVFEQERGEHAFTLQMAILLSEPGRDFTGGEFVLTEQRPRMQSRATVVPLSRGDAVIFAVHHRPTQGARGVSKVNVRHGVSELRSGSRHTLGIIFHDAKS
ncbi:MAG TPA: 2OG-Fe(II) oxygenase, partial [Methyloceanibacter sp.]|nr:2OG-Fe(II) oxygenase [Methyloceanibacter sp.]